MQRAMFDITVKNNIATNFRVRCALDINLSLPLSMLPLSVEGSRKQHFESCTASLMPCVYFFRVLTDIKHDIIREIIVVL